MLKKPKIIVFSGSSRIESCNHKLAKNAAKFLEQHEAEVNLINLRDYEMPLYNGDLENENGLPKDVVKLGELFAKSQGIVIASPEYNGFFSPLIKNTIDWLSRVKPSVFEGKIAGITSASPGGLGGIRALPHLRLLLENIGVMVLPKQIAVSNAFSAFDDENVLTDEKQRDNLSSLAKELVYTIKKLNS